MDVWRTHNIESFPVAKKVDDLPAVLDGRIAVIDLNDLRRPTPEALRKLIEMGHPENNGEGYNSRSEAAFAVITGLLKIGVPEIEIAGLLLNPKYAISERYLERSNPELQVKRELQRASLKVSTGWPDVYKNGNPKPTFPNAYAGLIRLDLNAHYNEFKNRLVVGNLPVQSFVGELSDKAVTVIRKVFLDVHKFDAFTQNIRDGIETLAYENNYHPIKAYFSTLEWDGTPRIRQFLSDSMGAENTELNQAVSMLLFVAAVRRVLEPGVKFDTMIVLEGKQGTGKSTALRILAGDEFFSDQDIISVDSKTQMELLEGVWIYEVCELSGLKHTEIAKVKSFISRQEDRGRPAYGRYKEVLKRQSIFIGTTNNETYLKDHTGNRRFLPVHTSDIDLAAIERDRDQLWAEALYWEAKGESIVLPEELWAAAAREQDARLYQDPWEDTLAEAKGELVGDEMRIFTSTLFEQLEIPKGQQKHFQSTQIAVCMRKLGWTGPKRIRIKGKSLMGYIRPKNENGGDNEAF